MSARSQYEADLVNGCAFGDSRRIFQYINHTLKQHSLPDTMTLDSSSESSDFGKATLFNHSFHSVFSSPGPPPDPSSLPPPACLLDELEITVHDVFVSLSHLGSKKSMGIDHIPSIVLKSCATVLCEPVHHLFTLCLSQSYIPPEWKIHCVTPIFKSGDKVSVKNYRPISLLCIISKVFERIVFDKIYDHIASFIICSEQYGFMRKRSTIQQLLIHLHSLIDSVSSGHQSDVVYLDIKKAFDSVSHSILLTKLWSAGLCGATWRFFVAYLSGRRQCVRVGSCVSDLLPVTSGVPQGSILGPLLFILYINDLPAVPIHSSLLLFADDSKCRRKIQSIEDSQLLQSDLCRLCEWSHSSGLIFNSSKSCVLSYHSPRSDPITFDYSIDDQVIDHQSVCKDLGVLSVLVFPG